MFAVFRSNADLFLVIEYVMKTLYRMNTGGSVFDKKLKLYSVMNFIRHAGTDLGVRLTQYCSILALELLSPTPLFLFVCLFVFVFWEGGYFPFGYCIYAATRDVPQPSSANNA